MKVIATATIAQMALAITVDKALLNNNDMQPGMDGGEADFTLVGGVTSPPPDEGDEGDDGDAGYDDDDDDAPNATPPPADSDDKPSNPHGTFHGPTDVNQPDGGDGYQPGDMGGDDCMAKCMQEVADHDVCAQQCPPPTDDAANAPDDLYSGCMDNCLNDDHDKQHCHDHCDKKHPPVAGPATLLQDGPVDDQGQQAGSGDPTITTAGGDGADMTDDYHHGPCHELWHEDMSCVEKLHQKFEKKIAEEFGGIIPDDVHVDYAPCDATWEAADKCEREHAGEQPPPCKVEHDDFHQCNMQWEQNNWEPADFPCEAQLKALEHCEFEQAAPACGQVKNEVDMQCAEHHLFTDEHAGIDECYAGQDFDSFWDCVHQAAEYFGLIPDEFHHENGADSTVDAAGTGNQTEAAGTGNQTEAAGMQ